MHESNHLTRVRILLLYKESLANTNRVNTKSTHAHDIFTLFEHLRALSHSLPFGGFAPDSAKIPSASQTVKHSHIAIHIHTHHTHTNAQQCMHIFYLSFDFSSTRRGKTSACCIFMRMPYARVASYAAASVTHVARHTFGPRELYK